MSRFRILTYVHSAGHRLMVDLQDASTLEKATEAARFHILTTAHDHPEAEITDSKTSDRYKVTAAELVLIGSDVGQGALEI